MACGERILSKRFDWEKPIVPPKKESGLPSMDSRAPSPPPDREPADLKKLRREIKTLQSKNYEKGARK